MISNYLGNNILNMIAGRTSSVTLGSVYCALSSTLPNGDGTNVTEPSGNGYSRVLLGNSNQALSQKMGAASNLSVENNEIVYFPEATGSWGTLGYFALYTSETNGNLIAYGQLAQSINPIQNTIPIVRIGDLTITLS